MKKVLVVLLMLPFTAFGQYPGGISSSLKLWLKANSGIALSPAGTIGQWNELSGANVTGNFATQGSNISMAATQNQPGYTAAGINFNPHVVFSQSVVNSISSNNAFVGTQMIDPYNNTMLQVINLHTLNGTGVWFKWQYNNTNANRMGNEVNNGGTNAGRMRFDFRGTNNYSTTIVNDKYFLAGFSTTQAQSIIRLNGANDNVLNYGTQAAFAAPAANPARITLGNEEYGDPYPTTIDIAEVILYNRALTIAERNKVESYLAVKYGFTLDQSSTAANDYTSSIGTIIWNRTANLPFVNNITGIGRDDGDSLQQRQSRSINTAGLVTIYHGAYNGNNFPTLNVLNQNNFQTDNTYLLFGDNGNTTALNRCLSSNPAFLRMNRSWKVQMTGSVGTVTLAVKKADVAPNTTHLLISTDSAFTSGTTTVYRLDTFGAYLSKSLILQTNTYFTYASDSLILRVASNAPLCLGNTLRLSALANGAASYSWTGPNNFSSVLQSPSIIGAGMSEAGIYTVNATTNGCPFSPASIQVNISPMPAPPTVITPLIYCQNDIALPLTAVGQNLTWYNAPIGVGGSSTPPTPSTVREDTLTYWVTQGNNGCESIRTKVEVHVRNRPNGIITGTSANICQGDIDTFYYFGNARVDAQYDWKSPYGTTTMLSGAGKGPILVRFDSSGVISVRLQVNNFGCVSNEMLAPITVRPRPIAHAVMQRHACLDEVVPIALNFTTTAIGSYKWDFDNGTEKYGAFPGGPYGISWATPGTKLVAMTTSSAGCKSYTAIDTITIHTPPAVVISSAIPPVMCMGDSLYLQAATDDTGVRYTWMPKQFFPDPTKAATWGTIQFTGYVKLSSISTWGCEGVDSILVKTKPCCEVAFPNVFTPNGDGRNDRFRIITDGHHRIADFRVVNRWGQTLFETRDESQGWDGTFNGVRQDMGTYFYYLRFRCPEGPGRNVEQKGEFILIR